MIDERKGNPHRPVSLPPCVYRDAIAPFLRFEGPLPEQLYAVGGRDQDQAPLNTVEMFDTWHGRWVPCPGMRVRRAGCGAAVLPDGRLLVVGGYDSNGIVQGVLSSSEAYDPIAQVWDENIAPLRHPRWGHGCASLKGLVFAVGGCSLPPGAPPREEFMRTLRSCEAYDPVADTWTPCADLQIARAGSRVVALGDRFLASVGGCEDVFGRALMLPTIELYEPELGRWSVLDTQLSTPRTTAAVAALDDNQMLVIGGAPSLSSAEVYRVPKSDSGVSCGMPSEEAVRMAERHHIRDMAEGRMGCQAAVVRLPAKGASYPLCTRQCVVVVGGESGEEDWELDQVQIKQFSSVLVYDPEDKEWTPEDTFPPIPTTRTAMALCIAPGRVYGDA